MSTIVYSNIMVVNEQKIRINVVIEQTFEKRTSIILLRESISQSCRWTSTEITFQQKVA